eukprot:CAMPEP_0197625138 /NCGR_PEP_ID=MMETSP1338-20131121/4575_1 /TAXON_ID=43686 ORGANISM="Pelagodinium beii, Strain RCC1491" /NCGR_SAMPLE_ID=MMETSP1338 /ASSEMBLY_ACC=CAM_ASM_000754 /LENGTH=686 /DNA_ID=CAMNT_0043195457 /DNA_START=95 /DNA_END=2155 /DNA_ORIENTATION=+
MAQTCANAAANQKSSHPASGGRSGYATSEMPSVAMLRFPIGSSVLVNMGRSGWKVAQVLSHNHREPSWPSDQTAPYKVRVDGGLAFVPIDDSRVIRAATEEDIARMRRAEERSAALGAAAERAKAAQLTAVDSPGRTQDVAAVLRYHAESCHVRPGLYANGGAMDWENQPDKFRRLLGAPSIDLPRSGADVVPEGPLHSLQSLGALLHDSCGITAWKGQGHARWSLRANPSSGALQPLEAFVFGQVGDRQAAQWHYNAYWHSLEFVADLPAQSWKSLERQLPQGAIVIALTSIVWRNAWKYGDPGFRYTHHDVGHQISSFAFAAAAQNATVVLLDSLTDTEIAGFVRADEPEDPVCILAIFPSGAKLPGEYWWRSVSISSKFWEGAAQAAYRGAPVETYYGAPEEEARPIIAAARAATRRLQPPSPDFWTSGAPPRELQSSWTSAGPLRPLIHARRSAQSYDPDKMPTGGLPSHIFYEILRRMLHQPAWFPWRPAVQPFLFVHRISGLEPGIYLLCRGYSGEELKKHVDPKGQLEWKTVPGVPDDVPLLLMRKGDVREEAKLGSCVQDIAADSAFAVAFLAEHLPMLEKHGAWWYKRVHWEACALGGALYLAAGAASADLQGTGIGCFFAPWVQALLGVDSPRWADVYHFTIGWPNVDRRVDGGPPYAHVEALKGRDRDTVSSRGA